MNVAANLELWVRPDVDVRESTMDGTGNGLFWEGGQLARASFVGAYRGRWRRASGEQGYRGRDEYVMENSGWRVTPLAHHTHRPDYSLHPIAAAQEPARGRRANCVFMPFYAPSDIGLAGQTRIVCIALYTCEVVQPHEGACLLTLASSPSAGSSMVLPRLPFGTCPYTDEPHAAMGLCVFLPAHPSTRCPF